MALGVRNTIRFRAFGIPMSAVSETIAWRRDELMQFRTLRPGSPFVTTATHSFDPDVLGTAYTWSMTFEPTVIGGRLLALVARGTSPGTHDDSRTASHGCSGSAEVPIPLVRETNDEQLRPVGGPGDGRAVPPSARLSTTATRVAAAIFGLATGWQPHRSPLSKRCSVCSTTGCPSFTPTALDQSPCATRRGRALGRPGLVTQVLDFVGVGGRI